MSLTVREVALGDRAAIGLALTQAERDITYPLGSDRFAIDHGADYFAFFDRLGETTTLIALDEDRVVGCATGVLRTVPRNGQQVRTWYCCDLKVVPSHRGRRIPLRLLLLGLRRHYRRCRRGYGIAMRPSDGQRAPVVRLLEHIRVIGSSVGPALHIFQLDAEEMASGEDVIERHRGPLSYLSLQGKKDLMLESTGRRMDALHVQFGPCAANTRQTVPQPGCAHFFCVPDGDPLLADLSAVGVRPGAQADIVHHGMNGWDWSFVLTSDL